MMKPKILVMGAVGKTGKEVVLGLLAKGFPVRAFVRVEDGRANKLRQAGAEIFVGDKLKAIASFGKILLTPTPDLDKYEKSLNHPVISQAAYATDFSPWMDSHSMKGLLGDRRRS